MWLLCEFILTGENQRASAGNAQNNHDNVYCGPIGGVRTVNSPTLSLTIPRR
jgi:hypothetical protein